MPRHIAFTRWETAADWAASSDGGTVASTRGLEMAQSLGTREHDGRSYEYGAWTSPWQRPGFGVVDLVSSWSAETPPGSWVEIAVQAPGSEAWRVLGAWADGDQPEVRTSVAGQPDVDTDVWHPPAAVAWRLRLTLLRTPGGDGPTVRMACAVVSDGPTTYVAETSSPGPTVGTMIDVPRLSQMKHRDRGGLGWCSPTSVSMVLSHAGRLPPGTDIPAVARAVFDPAYPGAGNWSFNAAYAAGRAGHAFVTRLRDLRDAEELVAAGLPLVAAVKYDDGALAGAAVPFTEGHLLVICGFTGSGDVVVNDPAAATDDEVRRTYDRGELERAWLGGSGGVVYVIHDDEHPLPPRTPTSSW